MNDFSQNLMFNGLGTLSFTVPNDGPYILSGKIQLPRIAEGADQSAVVCVVNQNGGPIYTGIAGADGFGLSMVCAANDLIAIVLSSSADVDQPLNVIKTTISVSQGL